MRKPKKECYIIFQFYCINFVNLNQMKKKVLNEKNKEEHKPLKTFINKLG